MMYKTDWPTQVEIWKLRYEWVLC
ncbi:unnamed protein product [Timema podura]|uniref:Uncharacterized protein n=1 Tax=Timema podura TaxID=61482 RepID=A0ABN7PCC7_TIMPD|nr:unnamed protein product [Timema podura]